MICAEAGNGYKHAAKNVVVEKEDDDRMERENQEKAYKPVLGKTSPGQVVLLPGSPFYQRMKTDEEYLLELDVDQMMQNHYNEAGLGTEIYSFHAEKRYGGWEYPASHQRGHFIGHWLSAASRMYSVTQSILLKGKIDYAVSKLKECQQENGGQWVFAIPPKYLDWAVRGKRVWAPHYNIHKTLMGLVDAYEYAGNEEALEVLKKAAQWFVSYMDSLTPQEKWNLLEVETGGMMEAWADLYGITGEESVRRLMEQYRHLSLEERLKNHPDPLLNRHANTTIPEIHGYCRAYEVTGEQEYLWIARKYWQEAVEERACFVTGAQNLAEAWTGKEDMSGRLGHSTSEQCTGYNMTRLADYLLRAEGGRPYADYMEQMLYNSTLAQCFWEGYVSPCGIQTESHRTQTGVCYYMPLIQGGRKPWGTKFDSFWCCYGTGVQACASFQNYIYYKEDEGIVVNQYIPSLYSEGSRTIRMEKTLDSSFETNPSQWNFTLKLQGGRYRLSLRVPSWCQNRMVLYLDGVKINPPIKDGYAVLEEDWQGQCLEAVLPLGLEAVELQGSGNLYAFRSGPVALAALTDRTCTLKGEASRPETVLRRNAEYEFGGWQNKFRARTAQGEMLEFMPLYDIAFDTYTVYHYIGE